MSNRRKRHKHITWGMGGRTVCGRTVAPGVLVAPEPPITHAQCLGRRTRLGWCRACWRVKTEQEAVIEADYNENHRAAVDSANACDAGRMSAQRGMP